MNTTPGCDSERDTLPAAANRKGAPQGQHAHALLGQGRRIMEQYFPGLTESLRAAGRRWYRSFFSGGGYFARLPQMPPTLYVSRPCLRPKSGAARSIANVEVIDGCDVLGLMADAEGGVVGVRVRAPARWSERRGALRRPGGGCRRPQLTHAGLAGATLALPRRPSSWSRWAWAMPAPVRSQAR